MTPEKIPTPSTANDYNVNNLSSVDGTDDEEYPRKMGGEERATLAYESAVATMRQGANLRLFWPSEIAAKH